MEPVVAQETDQEALERLQLIRAVQQQFGGTMQDALKRVEYIVKPRLEREREGIEREKAAAERARKVAGQRHYAGQVLAAMLTEKQRTFHLTEDLLTEACREAHRIARCMTRLELEYLDD